MFTCLSRTTLTQSNMGRLSCLEILAEPDRDRTKYLFRRTIQRRYTENAFRVFHLTRHADDYELSNQSRYVKDALVASDRDQLWIT